MRDYAKNEILEQYGADALDKINMFLESHNVNVILAYANAYGFDIVSGVLTNHSVSVDYVLGLCEVDMDDFANQKGWDGWDFDDLELIDVE